METYNQEMQEAINFITENDNFLVISHLHPDGDAIGSTLAVIHLLTNLKKNYTVANDSPTPKRFSFLQGANEIVNLSQERLQESAYKTVITIDVADFSRVGLGANYIPEESKILNIDHHPTNTRFGTINVIRSTAASTTEILYELINKGFTKQLDKKIAQALYTGLLTDTGGFRYTNTTQSVFQMAAHLLGYGIQPGEIAEYTLETISTTYLGLLKQVLPSLQFAYDEKVAFLAVSLEDLKAAKASKDDVDGLISYPRNIEGVEVGILLKEINQDEVKVSLRSKKIVDVAELAQRNGGGGHAKASGFTFHGTLQEATKHIIDELKNSFGG